MNMQEIFEKWMMNDRDSTPLWRLPINEIEYSLLEDPTEGVEIAALAENIRQCGLIHPILVEKQKKGKKYKLISGRRRIEAVKLLGRTHISSILVKDGGQSALKLALSENFMRKQPHFLDFAANLQSLLEFLSLKELAQLFSVKEDFLQQMLSLLTLTPYEMRLVRLLRLSEADTINLLSIQNLSLRKLLLEKMLQEGKNCDRGELIRQAVETPDVRLTQSEKICVKDIRVFLNSVERAACMMKQAGFDTRIDRENRNESYRFVITVSKVQYTPLKQVNKQAPAASKVKQMGPNRFTDALFEDVSRETVERNDENTQKNGSPKSDMTAIFKCNDEINQTSTPNKEVLLGNVSRETNENTINVY